MKKSFFKKLSFVLALAMVISVIAPAASAFAAAKPKLNSTKKYLHLGVDKLDEFDFNINNKQSGWKYTWESNKEDVAVVNQKNGVVTATGVGTAKITVFIKNAKGEQLHKLSASVVVRDNIKTLTITNKPEGDKLAVGVENDFNRGFVTNSGSTKKTSAITRWTVEPKDGATINASNGVFVATKAGKYTVTATAYQSAAKYADGVAIKDATASYEFTVAASMVGAKQVSLNKFDVTFDSAMAKADVEKNLSLSYMAGTSKVKLNTIKGVTMDADSKVATVEIYGTFIENATYVVDYPEMDPASFVSATTKVTDVVRAEIVTATAQIAKEQEITIALYNANGVNIANTDLLSRVELKSSNSATYVDSSARKLLMYKVGETTTLTAIYHTYEYDLTTGAEKGAVTAEKVITCVEQAVDNSGLLNAYTVADSGANANFGNAKHTIAAGDNGLYLFVELKGTKANGWEELKTDNKASNEGFTFKSTNQEVLLVGEDDGYIYPVKEGVASVVITYNKTVVGAANITVVAGRKVTNVTLDNQSFRLSNHALVEDVKTVNVTVKDQLGDNYSGSYTVTTSYNGTDNADSLKLLPNSERNSDTIKFSAVGVTKGSYTFTVKVTDVSNGYASTLRYITVIVEEASSDTVHHYALETSSNEYDMKINSWDSGTDWREDVTISLFGYASNGVRNKRVDISAEDYVLNVKDGNGANHTIGGASGRLTASGKDAVLALVSGPSIIDNMPTGTYVVTAKEATGDQKVVSTISFGVKNTQPTPTFTVKKLYSTKTDVLDAINDCLEFYVNGSKKTVLVISDAAVKGKTDKAFALEYVYIEQVIGGATIRFKVNTNNVVINYAQ